MSCARRAAFVALPLVLALAGAACAEDAWNPFKKPDERPRSRQQAGPVEPERPLLPSMEGIGAKSRAGPPQSRATPETPGTASPTGEPQPSLADRQPLPAVDERARAVERGDLQPVMASDGTGLPEELWQGLDARGVEAIVAGLDIPPRSAAIQALWRRLWTSSAATPGGAEGWHFEAMRLEALYRSGLLADIAARPRPADDTGSPLLKALAARIAIGAGDRERGCAEAAAVARSGAQLPKPVRGEMLLLTGYCAAAAGDMASAGLAADLARAEDMTAPLALAALDAAAAGQPFKPGLPKRLSLIEYRFLELARSITPAEAIERAEPALLVALATAEGADAATRIAAGEAAARLRALAPESLAEIYRSHAAKGGDAGDPLTARQGSASDRRATLFKAVEAERTPIRRARLARALLDDARQAGLGWPVAALLARPIESLAPAQEIGWFAETAIEINLASGRPEAARTWASFAGQDRGAQDRGALGGLEHWLVLIDIADPKWPGPRGAGLVHIEQQAVRGRLPGDLLHRLATVLDALDYQVPIPLWEAASRTPQPKIGHLPETGVLTQLQDAAKRREFARTVLLVIRTLGPAGADAAHMIALGDAMRALRRAGLEPDARRLGLEALITHWPRMAGN